MAGIRVSLIIPVYNTAKYIRNCIESAINQSISEIEIICIDDGSTDDSLNILSSYASLDNRIKIIRHEKNRGCAAARNTGLAAARGEFIQFLDSDDWIDRDYVKEMLDIAEKENIDVVYNSNIWLVPEEGEPIRFEPGNYGACIGFETTGFVDIASNIGNFTYSSCCCIYRKAYLDELKVDFPEGLDYTDNYFHIVTFVNKEKVYVTNKNSYHYVRHSDSICEKNSEIVFSLDIIKVYEFIFKYYLENQHLHDKKINFYELKWFFEHFKDRDMALFLMKKAFLLIKANVFKNKILYNNDEFVFFKSIAFSRNLLMYNFLTSQKDNELKKFFAAKRLNLYRIFSDRTRLFNLRNNIKSNFKSKR